MSASQNNLTTTVVQQDSGGVNIIGSAGRTVSFNYAGACGQYTESYNVTTGGVTPTLPISPCGQLYIKNLDATNYVTVTWTPNGGSSNVVKAIRPGGVIIFWDLDAVATAGITALTLTANTAACKVEMFLGG